MTRKEAQMKILQALGELDVMYPDGYGYEEQSEYILKTVEKFMMPKHRGSHQTIFDLAMGSKPEWDKE